MEEFITTLKYSFDSSLKYLAYVLSGAAIYEIIFLLSRDETASMDFASVIMGFCAFIIVYGVLFVHLIGMSTQRIFMNNQIMFGSTRKMACIGFFMTFAIVSIIQLIIEFILYVIAAAISEEITVNLFICLIVISLYIFSLGASSLLSMVVEKMGRFGYAVVAVMVGVMAGVLVIIGKRRMSFLLAGKISEAMIILGVSIIFFGICYEVFVKKNSKLEVRG